MPSLIAIALVLFVAAVTPGPNNLVVMRTAVDAGFVRALTPIVGIVLGSLALLALIVGGLGRAFGAWPLLHNVIATGGAAYLIWLGVRLVWFRTSAADTRVLPHGALGLFVFQFLNPKGWLMLLTVAAAASTRDAWETFVQVAPLAAGIPATCLLLWAGLGSALSRQLGRPRVRAWTDRVFGALLIASALPLLA
jgi:threonine/homoserine/homoserine lactone efflux protein